MKKTKSLQCWRPAQSKNHDLPYFFHNTNIMYVTIEKLNHVDQWRPQWGQSLFSKHRNWNFKAFRYLNCAVKTFRQKKRFIIFKNRVFPGHVSHIRAQYFDLRKSQGNSCPSFILVMTVDCNCHPQSQSKFVLLSKICLKKC